MTFAVRGALIVGLTLMATTANALTMKELVKEHPDHIQTLFKALDLSRPGLEAVKAALDKGDKVTACEALVTYYKKSDTVSWLRHPAKPSLNPNTIKKADAVLHDTFTFYEQTATVPRRPNGGLDWDYRGPSNDKEWAWALNRHFHLGTLLSA